MKNKHFRYNVNALNDHTFYSNNTQNIKEKQIIDVDTKNCLLQMRSWWNPSRKAFFMMCKMSHKQLFTASLSTFGSIFLYVVKNAKSHPSEK